MEILGHAIEYLTDSYVIREAASGNDDAQAIKILMGLNMAIYFECEEIIPLSQRVKDRFRTYLTQFTAPLNLPRSPLRMETSVASKVEHAKSLVIERYGKSFDRQDPFTGEWWIISESGMILGHGKSSDAAWMSSAFMPALPHHTSFPD